MAEIFKLTGHRIQTPFPRLPYEEAIGRFGTDKPDTRFGLELVDFSECLRQTEFPPFRDALGAGRPGQGSPRSRLFRLLPEAVGRPHGRGPGLWRSHPGLSQGPGSRGPVLPSSSTWERRVAAAWCSKPERNLET